MKQSDECRCGHKVSDHGEDGKYKSKCEHCSCWTPVTQNQYEREVKMKLQRAFHFARTRGWSKNNVMDVMDDMPNWE